MAKFLNSFPIKSSILHLIFVIPGAVLSTFLVLYSQNSLYLNDDWIVQKRMLSMGIMGADEYLVTRIPFAQNILNLGSYHGFQEAIFRKKIHPVEVIFNVEIPEQSYLDFTFNRHDDSFSGIRLSTLPELPSLNFESTVGGKFLSADQIQSLAISSGWHRAEITSDETGLVLTLDHEAKIPIASRFLPGLVGFRSGLRGARVDRVSMKTTDGNWLHLSFGNYKNWALVFVLNLGLLVIMGSAVLAIAVRKSGAVGRERLFLWTIINIVGFICLTVWYVFDFYHYSSLYHTNNGITHRFNTENSAPFENKLPSVEELRYRAFSFWYGLSGGETVSRSGVLNRGYPMDRIFSGPIYCGPVDEICILVRSLREGSQRERLYRVLFIGTSQTFGAGAGVLDDTFFALVHRYLRNAVSSSTFLESINISVSGSSSAPLLEEYRRHYLQFRPDLVVINLSNNDYHESEKFESAINGFLKDNQSSGIKTIILEEANSFEKQSRYIAYNHEILRSLGRRYDVPVYPLHDFLNRSSVIGSGTIWWDFVHLTAYGQEVVARWLAPKVLAELRAGAARYRPLLELPVIEDLEQMAD